MQLFERIPEEKQRQIISAGFNCFGQSTYKKTSMADIAKEAGIAKASLFQYFTTKENLYLYLLRHAITEIEVATAKSSTDFFECLQNVAAAKMQVMAKYSGLYAFLTAVYTEVDPHITPHIKRAGLAELANGNAQIFAKVNWAKFKSEIDTKKVMNIITWVTEGCVKQSLGTKSAAEINSEINGYLNFIKTLTYRLEYL